MGFGSLRYRRRDFLGICATAPLIADVAAGVEPVNGANDPLATLSLNVPKIAEADLAREVETLLKLVDPTVLYRPVQLSKDQNAWTFWEQAIQAHIEEPQDDEFQEGIERFVENKPGLTDGMKRQILDWIGQNDGCQKLIDQGIARGSVDLPREMKSFRLSLATQEAFGIRSLARLKNYLCSAHLLRGELDEALREAVSVLDMGMMLIRSECFLVDYLLGQITQGIGFYAIDRIGALAGAPDDLLRTCIDRLTAAKVNQEDVARVFRVEYCCWLLPFIAEFAGAKTATELAARYLIGQVDADYKWTDGCRKEYERSIRQFAALLEGHPNPFDKEATVRLGSRFNARCLEDLSKPWLEREHDLLDKMQEELAPWPAESDPDWWILLGNLEDNPNRPRKLTDKDLRRANKALRKVDNPLGKRLIAQMSPFITPFFDLHEARLESVRIRIALRLYEKKHGRLPAQLGDLVIDQQLPEVPRDPYDGDRFRYSKERRVVWCVGPKGTNQGMIPEQQDPESSFNQDAEMTWRIAER